MNPVRDTAVKNYSYDTQHEHTVVPTTRTIIVNGSTP